MKIIVILILLLCLPEMLAGMRADTPEIGSLEKQALETVQRLPVSRLDAELPASPFAAWFNQLVGPDAGVIWQLTECGERIELENGAERDLIACTETNALLSDGRKIMVAVSVGTFKRGVYGAPMFYSAVIDQDNQLYPVPRLRDLPGLLRIAAPKVAPVRLPNVMASLSPVNLPSEMYEWGTLSSSQSSPYPYPDAESVTQPSAAPAETPAAPAETPAPAASPAVPQQPQKVQEGILQGRALSRVMPIYPANARSLNASGAVVVKILVSEAGRVIEATAISGHPVLRLPAAEAARKWVFKPTTLNGQPVKVESVLTFVFNL